MPANSLTGSENSLMADMLAQADNLRRVVHHLVAAERKQLEAAARFLNDGRPIYLVGMASSAYLCMPAETYLNQHGRHAVVLNASDALYSLLPVLKNANVVIVSRSGETVEIVKLAEALAQQGTGFAAVTNEPESTLAQLAARIVWADTRKDALVSINVVTGLMTTVLALTAAIVGELDGLRPEFERLTEAMGGVVEQAARQAAAMHSLFEDVRPLHLLYRGYDRGAASCGRLVLEEIARWPGVVLECAEFRQGPNEVVDSRFGAAVFIPDGKQGVLNNSLAEDILRAGGRVLRIGSKLDAAGGKHTAGGRALGFSIPSVHPALRPALNIVPLQFLAYELALAQGYTPGTMRYITKVILTEEGIPNQE